MRSPFPLRMLLIACALGSSSGVSRAQTPAVETVVQQSLLSLIGDLRAKIDQ